MANKRRQRTIGDALSAPRNARERALAQKLDKIGAAYKLHVEAADRLFVPITTAMTSMNEKADQAEAAWKQSMSANDQLLQSLLYAEADRLRMKRGDYRNLALRLIIERRKLKKRPIA